MREGSGLWGAASFSGGSKNQGVSEANGRNRHGGAEEAFLECAAVSGKVGEHRGLSGADIILQCGNGKKES